MSLIRINREPSRGQLNGFGLLWLVFVAGIGWMVSRNGHLHMARILWVLAVILPILGWIFPTFMRWLYVGMAYAALPIGFVVSHVILAAVYYFVVTPLGWILRLAGYDPMARGFDETTPSYWAPRDRQSGIARYFRQF